MFINLEKYLRHRTGKLCHKKTTEVQDNSDDAGSPSQVPEIVQVSGKHSNFVISQIQDFHFLGFHYLGKTKKLFQLLNV